VEIYIYFIRTRRYSCTQMRGDRGTGTGQGPHLGSVMPNSARTSGMKNPVPHTTSTPLGCCVCKVGIGEDDVEVA